MSISQKVLVQSLREEDHGSTQIHSTFVGHDGDKALSYPDFSDLVRQFCMGRESVEDSRRRERPPDFQTLFRIEKALEASPNASVRDIAQTIGIAPSTVFYLLTQVLHLEFPNWRSVSHQLGEDQKRRRVQLVVSLQAEIERTERRNWTEFCTGDESSGKWKNFSKGCWLSLDEELLERFRPNH
jgi:hypothetical protein